jgi:hypothetical protein
MQPFWHTGLRANLALSSAFALNALVVNGVNNAFENNKSPSLGLQAVITASDVLSVAVGYLGALNPTQGGNGPFQNFFDVVATVTAGGFKLVANADLNLYKPGLARTARTGGASASRRHTRSATSSASVRASNT